MTRSNEGHMLPQRRKRTTTSKGKKKKSDLVEEENREKYLFLVCLCMIMEEKWCHVTKGSGGGEKNYMSTKAE